ncbi:hypothetical protein [Cupriavidus sp. MP-37]|uniref:hypothetical protein n=1 Tax=Cupriavidus sp. MP-37 TaxID=2884455 RepID=UPI001D0B3224|nr:hypothetical protein [Cupriavidus sp. MP-37]UDM53508.1 hypothetical protein LIN44_19535 [Cupriavidus sp. MP-37]
MARIVKVGRCYARRATGGKARRPLSRAVRRLRHEAAVMSALLRAARGGWQKSRGIWHLPGPWRVTKIGHGCAPRSVVDLNSGVAPKGGIARQARRAGHGNSGDDLARHECINTRVGGARVLEWEPAAPAVAHPRVR